MAFQQQTSWGWRIAFYLFLAAAGAAAIFFSVLSVFIGGFAEIAGLGAFVGTLVVLASTFFLLADLGTGRLDIASAIKAPRMALLPSGTSWMLRGTVILVLTLVFGFIYSIPLLFAGSAPNIVIGIVAAIFSIITILYTGFLLASSKGTPFWNTPMLPVLFLFSGLSTGIAIMALISISTLTGPKLDGALHLLGMIHIPLIVLELITLGAYLETGSHGSEYVRESVRILVRGRLAPLFWVILIAVGLIVPLILEATGAAALPIAGVISAICLLLGGLYLRYLILRSALKTLPLPSGGLPIAAAGWTQVAR